MPAKSWVNYQNLAGSIPHRSTLGVEIVAIQNHQFTSSCLVKFRGIRTWYLWKINPGFNMLSYNLLLWPSLAPDRFRLTFTTIPPSQIILEYPRLSQNIPDHSRILLFSSFSCQHQQTTAISVVNLQADTAKKQFREVVFHPRKKLAWSLPYKMLSLDIFV